MNARKLHRLNALFLTVFIMLHMATHISGLWGIEAYNATQKALRQLYRNPVVEPLLLTSSVSQIVLGAILLVRATRRGLRGFWSRVQVISGGIFLWFFTEHLIALVLARWVDGLDTDFYWPASVMSGAPFTWYFIPYYYLGVSALFVHIGCAVRLHLIRTGQRQTAKQAFWVFTVFGVILATLINSMLLGMFYDIRLPDDWINYLRQFVSGYSPLIEAANPSR